MLTDSSESSVIVEESCAMLLVGSDHRVSYANPLAHKLLNYERGGLHGIAMEALLLPSRRSETYNVQAVLQGQAARRWKSALRDYSGARVEVHVSADPCLDYRRQIVAVKLRVERVSHAGSPLTRQEIEFGSGPRRIVSVPTPTLGANSRPPIKSSPPPPLPNASARVPRTTAADRTQDPKASAPVRPGADIYSSRSRPSVTSVAPPPLLSPMRPPPLTGSGASTFPTGTKPRVSTSDAPPKPDRSRSYPPAAGARPSGPVSKAPPSSPVSKAPPVNPRAAGAQSAAFQTGKTSRRAETETVLGEDGTEQIEAALQLLGWLRQRVDQRESLDEARERARLKYVLNEATELVAQVRCDARTRRR